MDAWLISMQLRKNSPKSLDLKSQLSHLGPKRLPRTVAHLLMMLKTPGLNGVVPQLGGSITWFSCYDGGPTQWVKVVDNVCGLVCILGLACILGLTNFNKQVSLPNNVENHV